MFVSLTGDFAAAAFVAVVAVFCLAQFLSPLGFPLSVGEPLNVVALVALLMTAFVVTSLVSRRRTSFREIQALEDQPGLEIDTIPALAGVSVPSGAVEIVKRRWLDYTGLRPDEAPGSGWTRALHPDDRATFAAWGSRRRAIARALRPRSSCGVRTASTAGFPRGLLMDADGRHLRHGAAPSLPETCSDAIDGAAIGPRVGSCGAATYRSEPVVVSDEGVASRAEALGAAIRGSMFLRERSATLNGPGATVISRAGQDRNTV